MNLYQISFDGQPDYIEAENFTRAIAIWQDHMIANEEDWDPETQPESVALIHDKNVIRAE